MFAVCFVLAPLVWGQEESAETLITKAILDPTNGQAVGSAIWAMSKRFETRLAPRFAELFQLLERKDLRQSVAIVMLRHGETDQVYFDELARYAREAVSSTVPHPIQLDENGNEIRNAQGRPPLWSPAFLDWCKARSMETCKCFNTVVEYPLDVAKLAGVGDPRAIPILRSGLGAMLPTTVQMSVAALARFNDTESIPMIATTIGRFPRAMAELIATGLQEFTDPRVEPLLDRYVTNPKAREEMEQTMRNKRTQPQ
jgi:hypothetical protein